MADRLMKFMNFSQDFLVELRRLADGRSVTEVAQERGAPAELRLTGHWVATVHWLPLAGAQGGAAATTWWVTHTPTDHRLDSEIVYALVWFQFLIFCTQPLAGA